jgi:alkanesulfonate monooxygenase SsuD/methylene tetrahydromethanopterin reductase-like flavin-dependent oxidoreductase (luciferase family)
VRLSTVILPIERWPVSIEKWRRAEALGFHAAYTYDHLSWQRLIDRPWFGAIPTLTAAATATSRIRLGTMVTSPNFRHPVPLAKDLLSIDDVSAGRLIVGVGSGGLGADATVLGEPAWTPRERTLRFTEFVGLLDELLRSSATTADGDFYRARDVRMLPGTVQQPRPPLFVAANGVRGMRLAAQYGDGWITLGRSADDDESCLDVVTGQIVQLDGALASMGRHPSEFEKVLLDGFSNDRPLDSLNAFVDWAGRYQEIGVTELVIHWPEPNSLFEADMNVFEEIATEGLSQIDSDPS